MVRALGAGSQETWGAADGPAPEAAGSDQQRSGGPTAPGGAGRREHTARQLAGAAPIILLATSAGLAAAVAGCHPTGTAVVDPLYSAVFAALVVLAGYSAPRGCVLWLAVLAAAWSRNWLTVPGAAALVTAFAGSLLQRRSRWVGASSAALSVEVVLRWPPVGFSGADTLLALAAVTPLLVGAVAVMSRPARRMALTMAGGIAALAVVVSTPLLIEAALSYRQIAGGIGATRQALAQVRGGKVSADGKELAGAASDFTAASGRLGSWWTEAARLVPVVSQQRQVLAVSTSVARAVSVTARDDIGSLNFNQLRYSGGGVDVAKLAALAGPLGALHSQLVAGSQRLAHIGSAWLLPPVSSRLSRLDKELTGATSSTATAVMAAQAAPSLLGADGTRNYFIGFTQPAESRGLGGLLIWYGDLRVSDGHMSLQSFGDVHKLADILDAKGGGKLTGLPGYLARYGQFKPQNTFLDVTYAPDLATVTSVVSQLYSETGNPPIDGMILLDPRSLGTLVGATGPLAVPGLGTLTQANTEKVLDRQQYAMYPAANQTAARKAALDDALRLASQRVAAGSLPGVGTLLRQLGPDVKTGDLLFWSTHRKDQPLLIRTGLAGRFPSPGNGDLLSVITQNAANNKTDAYLHRTINDAVRYNPVSGAVSSTVTVTLHNGAPTSGLSDEAIGSYRGSGLPKGADLLWFSLYSPLSLESAAVGSSPVHLTATPEFGVQTYSGYAVVDSGQTVTITVHLAGRLKPGAGYSIVLHQQPTVIADTVSVEVTPAGRGPTQTWRPPQGLNVFRNFSLRGSQP